VDKTKNIKIILVLKINLIIEMNITKFQNSSETLSLTEDNYNLWGIFRKECPLEKQNFDTTCKNLYQKLFG
jgi:hypothetical protein